MLTFCAQFINQRNVFANIYWLSGFKPEDQTSTEHDGLRWSPRQGKCDVEQWPFHPSPMHGAVMVRAKQDEIGEFVIMPRYG